MCCCVLFRDLEGKQRLVRHACCPTHGGPTDPEQPDEVKAAHP